MNKMVRLIFVVGVAACGVVLVSLGLARHDADLIAPVNIMLLVLAVLVYLLPTGLAMYRDCQSTAWIVMVNLLLGWTILGWFAAIGWAAGGKVRQPPHPIGTPPTHPVPGH
jgi:hypothetical protein